MVNDLTYYLKVLQKYCRSMHKYIEIWMTRTPCVWSAITHIHGTITHITYIRQYVKTTIYRYTCKTLAKCKNVELLV